jgi:hypothetical protein
MIFQPGTYYVGDPGFVLPNEDLRTLFAQTIQGGLRSGPRELEASMRQVGIDQWVSDCYWLAVMPAKQGTIYDQNKNGWGFDWGCFGLVPWKWLSCTGSYDSNKIEFPEPFTCSSTENNIVIGHLHFASDPK